MQQLLQHKPQRVAALHGSRRGAGREGGQRSRTERRARRHTALLCPALPCPAHHMPGYRSDLEHICPAWLQLYGTPCRWGAENEGQVS